MCSTNFRDPGLLRAYADCVVAFQAGSSILYAADGITPATGNSVASQFWRGFNGSTVGRWDAASKRTFAYAQFCAGRDCAAAAEAA